MIYQASITTVENTLDIDPLETELKVSKGLVYRVEIYFPPGSSGLCGVQIFEGAHQVYPTTNGEWFIGDNVFISFEDLYFITNETNIFRIITYNTDTKYDHKIIVRLGVVGRKEFIAYYIPEARIDELIAQITQEREAEAITQAERLREIRDRLPVAES